MLNRHLIIRIRLNSSTMMFLLADNDEGIGEKQCCARTEARKSGTSSFSCLSINYHQGFIKTTI